MNPKASFGNSGFNDSLDNKTEILIVHKYRSNVLSINEMEYERVYTDEY